MFIVTIDDAPLTYFFLVLCRSYIGYKTAALFIRPQNCFNNSQPKFIFKKLFYKLFKKLPRFELLTITPHEWEPSFSIVSNRGTYDPQYCDLFSNGSLKSLSVTDLADVIKKESKSSLIVTLPGSITKEKGYEFFTEIAQQSNLRLLPIKFLAAGAVAQDMRLTAKEFVKAGGLLIDRTLTDTEIESLYAVSDGIWACYDPSYNQASGIFGRALQTDTPVFLRAGSMLEKAAAKLQVRSISLDWGEKDMAIQILGAWTQNAHIAANLTEGKAPDEKKVEKIWRKFEFDIRSSI